MYDRITKLIGETNIKKINNTTVAVIGLGGVGGSALECLVRSGIENIIIVDFDKMLLCPFELIESKPLDEDDEYVPKYILETEENLNEFLEKKLTNMIVDNVLEYTIDNIN